MLGAYFKDFFGKRNAHKKMMEQKIESVQTKTIKKTVLERAIHMSDYVQEVETLVKMHPVAKRGLIDYPQDFKL